MVLKMNKFGIEERFTLDDEIVQRFVKPEDFTAVIRSYQTQIDYLKNRLVDESSSKPKIIYTEIRPYKEAKTLVKKFIDAHKSGVTTTEIAESLCLDIPVVMKVLSQLKKEGKIGTKKATN